MEVGGNRRSNSGNARQVGDHGFGSGVAFGLPRGAVDKGRGGAAFRVRSVEASGLYHLSEHTASWFDSVAVFSNRVRMLPVKICCMKITAALMPEAIEACLPFWVDRMGFTKTVEVPEGDRLAFVILARDGAELMLQTVESVRKDLAAFAPDGPPREIGRASCR